MKVSLFMFTVVRVVVYALESDVELKLQLLHSSSSPNNDFISHLHFMRSSGLLLITYCFSHEVWVLPSFHYRAL